MIRIYQEVVSTHSTQMVKGILSLLSGCPPEVAHTRKEMLIAARHILSTELRIKFVPHMEQLFNENVLLGKGWTVHESLRPLAYSTLADLVHHVRQHLPHADLARAVQLFSRNAHDETLPTSIQTMSCKLLLNLVECIRTRSEQESKVNARDLLMRMMEVFVLKFKTVSKLQLPVLMTRHRQQQQALQQQLLLAQQAAQTAQMQQNGGGAPATPGLMGPATSGGGLVPPGTPEMKVNPLAAALMAGGATGTAAGAAGAPAIEIKTEDVKSALEKQQQQQQQQTEEEAKKSKFGFPASQAANYSVSDCRALVKTLVCGVKTITWGCTTVKAESPAQKQFQPKETLVYIRLVKWAMEALDIYTLNTTPAGQAMLPPQAAVQVSGGGGGIGGGGIGGIAGLSAPTGARGVPAAMQQQAVRPKEEKEVLEHFAGVFALLNPQTFKVSWSQLVTYGYGHNWLH